MFVVYTGNILDAVGATSDHWNDTRKVLHKQINQLETNHYFYNQNMVNLFFAFAAKVFLIADVSSTSSQMQLHNKQSPQGSSVKHLLSHMLQTPLKTPLTTLLGLCNTAFSSVLQLYPLGIIMPCIFESFTYILLNLKGTAENKQTLSHPTLAPVGGAPRSNKEAHVFVKIIEVFVSLSGVSGNIQRAAFRINFKRRKKNTIVRIFGCD